MRLPSQQRKQLLLELSLTQYAQGIFSFGKARELAGIERLAFGRLCASGASPGHMCKTIYRMIFIMPMLSNTSPILGLAVIHCLRLARQHFGILEVPSTVVSELKTRKDFRGVTEVVQALQGGWLIQTPVQDLALAQALALDLDRGEAEAIALALECGYSQVLIDESDGPTGAKTPTLTNTPAPTTEGDNSGQGQEIDNSGYVNLPGEGPLASSIFTTTPDSGGKLYHLVKPGETLWLIAISYGVKIADIRRLNYMAEADSIYPKEKLLIREGVFISPAPPKPSNTPAATLTISPTQILFASPTVTPVEPTSTASGSVITVVGVFLAVLLLLLGIMLIEVGQTDNHRRIGW